MKITLDAKNRQIIADQVKSDVTMIRTVSGLSLKVNCYNVNGGLGSCVYPDLCSLIKSTLSLDQSNCPQNLIDNGIPCTCPFNLPIRDLNINESFGIMFEELGLSYIFGSGDFDVTIKATTGTTNVLCLNIKYTIRPK